MRFFKKTVFWVLVLAVLGGSFYFFDRKSDEKKAETEAQKRLFGFEPADVNGFVIRKKGAPIVTVRKEGGTWVLTTPVTAAGDPQSIEKFLEKLVKAKLDGVLYEKAAEAELREMGLNDPYLSVDLTTSRGAASSISFGDKGPTLNVSFAAIKGDPRVLRVNSDIRSDADKGAYEMRSKTVLPFDPTRVKNFDIIWAGRGAIHVEHPSEGKWQAIGLPEGKTDFLRVMEMLVKFKKGEVKAFVEENPSKLDAYGLKDPRARVLFLDEKNVKQTLLIGGRDKERRGYYAMAGEGGNVVLLEEDLVDSIPREPADLEEKADAKG